MAMDVNKYSQTQMAASSPIISTPRSANVPNFSEPGQTFSQRAEGLLGISPAYAGGQATTAPATTVMPGKTNLPNVPSATTALPAQSPYTDVTPKDKIGSDLSRTPPSPLMSQMNATSMEVQGLRSDFNNLNPTQITAPNKPAVSDRDPNMIPTIMNMNRTPYQNPAMERAMNRAQFGGDPHHEYGNNS